MKNWNLTGESPTNQEKIYVPEMVDGVPKAYEGEIKEISDIYQQKKYNAEGMDNKVTMNVEMEDGKSIPMFVTFKVMKGSGSYSNSKLFDVIDVAGGLSLAQNVALSENGEKIEFLKRLLIGKKAKFLVKTVKKGQEDQYSVIDKFTKIWDASKAEEESVK